MSECRNKKIIVTGFDPFGNDIMNPSWEAVVRLRERIGDYSVCKLLVKTAYNDAARAVISYAAEIDPDAVLSVGQAGGRECVTPEMIAVNLRYSETADNDGKTIKDEPVVSGGADAYFSTIPARKISDALNRRGIRSRLSMTAGTFVCNDLMYSLLHHFRGTGVRCGFIHVPYIPEQNHPDRPAVPLAEIITALETAVENI